MRRAVLRAVLVAACAVCAGCPPGGASVGVSDAALKERLSGGLAKALAEVVDGPGAGEPYEKYVERQAAVRAVRAVGDIPEGKLREKAGDFTYDRLLETPGVHRGEMVFAYLIVGELRELDFRAGGERLRLLVGGTPQGEFYAVVYPARRGRGRLYGGDVVWCSGVFVKVFSFVDGNGEQRRVPLIAGPPPTYTKDWYPYGALLRELGLETFFPLKMELEAPPPYLFVEMDGSGLLTIDGRLHGRPEFEWRLEGLAEAGRYRHRRGVVVLRVNGAPPEEELAEVRKEAVGRGLLVVVKDAAAVQELVLPDI